MISLAEAGRWLSGGTPDTSIPAYWDGETPWISAASLKDFNITQSDRRVSRLGASSGTRIVPQDTILFVVRGMSLKSEFRIGITRLEVAFGQDCKAIIPRKGINSRFLAYSLKASAGRVLAMVDEAGHGTGRLPTDQLSALTIGVPELAEQLRIAEVLDSIDKSIELTERAIAKAELSYRGVLQRTVDSFDVASTPSSTVEQEFDIKAGITLGPHRLPRHNPVGYLRVANVQRGSLDLNDVALLEASPQDTSTYSLLAGDLLVVEGHASPSEIGRCALVQDSAGILLFQNHLFRLRAKRLSPEYGLLWLNSDYVRSYWRRMCATSSGLYTINSRQLRHMPVRVPEASMQEQIVRVARAHGVVVDRERRRRAKLQLVRLGLMEDLLTGRVRANIDGDVA